LIDAAVERALHALRKLRNAFAHSAELASLSDPAHHSRLEAIYAEARANPLWAPLETALAAQPTTANGPLDPALRDYILLITILVAFLEATAQQLRPYQPPVVMGSDVDLLITAPDAWLAQRDRFALLAELWGAVAQPDLSVDLVLHSCTEANRRAQEPGSLVQEAFSHGVLLDGQP
jgi:hypothetical protein